MAPIFTPDGTEVEEVILPDGSEASEVIAPDGTVVFEDAIPDSEADQKLVHRWVLDDVNGMVEDSIANADGTNNGVTSVSGDWAGGSAGDGDGVGDYIETTTWGDFGSNMGTDFAIALSLKTSTSDDSIFLGVMNQGDSMRLEPQIRSGRLELQIADADGDFEREETDSDGFNDDQPYRVVFNKTGNSATDFEIWTNQSQEATSTGISQGFSNASDFDIPVWLFAENREGSLDSPLDGVIDDICVFNESLTQSEIESYQNPWS